MKEFIEKLIARLEEESYSTTDIVFGGRFDAVRLNSAIEIVNELAEEMGVAKNAITTWIPCSGDQKPKEGKFYNVTIFDGEEYRTEPAYYARIGYLGQRDKKAQWWTDCTSNAELIEEGYDEVIAWQPLPPAYVPKGE